MPIFAWCFCGMLGVLLASYGLEGWFFVLILALLSRRYFPRYSFHLVLASLTWFITYATLFPQAPQLKEKEWNGELVRLKGRVSSVLLPKKLKASWSAEEEIASSCFFEVEAIAQKEGWCSVGGNLWLRLPASFAFYRGQALEAIGQLYYQQEHLSLKVRTVEGLKPEKERSLWISLLLFHRDSLLSVFERFFPPASEAFFRTLLLGERPSGEDELLSFYKVGLAHILAISGLHIYLLLSFLETGLKRLGFYGQSTLYGVSLLILILFFFLVHFTPSISRSVLLFGLTGLGLLLGRCVSLPHLGGVLFLFFLVSDPLVLYDISFQLTFSAFLGIIWLYPALNELPLQKRLLEEFKTASGGKRWLLWYYQQVFFCVVLFLMTAPFTLYHFNQFHFWILWITPFLLFPFQVLLFGLFFLAFGGIYLPEALLQIYCWFLEQASALFLQGIVALSYWSEIQGLVYERPLWIYLFYGMALYFLGNKHFYRASFCGLLWFFCFLSTAIPPPVISFVNVGQGNLTLLQKDGKVILYDAGSLHPFAMQRVVSFLWKRGIREIDECIISHADADHCNLLLPLSRWFPIHVIRGTSRTFETHPLMFQKLLEKGSRFFPLYQGERLQWGPQFYAEVLSPRKEESVEGSENNASLVLKVRLGKIEVGLTGDIEQEQMNRLFLETPITLLPHHGSARNDLSVWPRLGAVQIVSCEEWFKHTQKSYRYYTYKVGHIEIREHDCDPFYRVCFRNKKTEGFWNAFLYRE
jgi:competence protein ComEC